MADAPRFFATASRGTEEVLADELRSLGAGPAEVQRGGVSFGTQLEDAYRACLWSRVASRVLFPLTRFEVDGADALYQGVHAIDWADHVGPDKTLAVDAAGGRSPAGPRHFVALKTKDAIVDRVRDAEGSRPDVDTANADFRVNVHLDGSQVIVSLDLAGRGLHRRGIGRSGAGAPLKENLAAALLRIAGWHEVCRSRPLFDPLCGSGTLLTEAAWIAIDVAPGLSRKRIGAEGWRGHDANLWSQIREEAQARLSAAGSRNVRIAGSDASAAVVETAQENMRRAGVHELVRIERREFRDVVPPWSDAGVVVTNPPYGERLGEVGELGPFYESIGDILKHRFPGWTAWVLAGNPTLGKRIGLRPAARHVVYNGPIESRWLKIPIGDAPVEGTRGPGWRKPSREAGSFEKRLRKNLKAASRWVRRENLTCYRLYDADVPEYNLAVDWYDGAARVEEYERPRKIDPDVAERHLRDAMLVVPAVLEIDPVDVVLRVRAKRTAGQQHERRAELKNFRAVREGNLRFKVNLTDYLDTGLFLDDRLLRRWIAEHARGADFLNLFAYTCAATVAAASGGARSTTSVDLSNTYLSWGRNNFNLNGMNPSDHRFLRTDVLQWLEGGGDRRRYDLIFLAPPTHSKSKSMRREFDVQTDHAELLTQAAKMLNPGGRILFTSNLKGFVLDETVGRSLSAEAITEAMTPPDFRNRPRLKAWLLQ